MSTKILTVVGARPQFIKAAAVSREIAPHPELTEVLVHTGQHFDQNMSSIFFEELDIAEPNINLGIGGGTHGQNTGQMIQALEAAIIAESPDIVLVYGDTDSTLAGAIAATKIHVPIAHVEAGLRSFNRFMPEEINRVLTDHAADIHYLPSKLAEDNLKAEGISGDNVKVVGDVMYDVVKHYAARASAEEATQALANDDFILCTIHRAENTDNSNNLKWLVDNINAISEYSKIIIPLHPRTVSAMQGVTGMEFGDRVAVIAPVGYLEMHWLTSKCKGVLTDSGGLQKEAYFHRKPCVTLRDETEWTELVELGCNVLLPPGTNDSLHTVINAMDISVDELPEVYGDGTAAKKIVQNLAQY